ncbi:MAG: integrase core domain-containing protein [Chloroflexi bacterium]|nr:integrase core domain-containing protein [Chloroflexota bacterium]
MLRYLRPWLGWLLAWLRIRTDHAFEVAALKQQLAMYEGRRPDIRDSDRLFWVLLVLLFPRWRDSLVVVRPETVVRWHRAGWRRYWTWKSRPHRRGRPRIDPEARELILRLARENRTWGSVRIQGELRALGHDVSAETVRRYRLQALRRPPSPNWRAFLTNHRHELWACDFFTVPTISFTTLYVFFFVSHARRRIEHIHVTKHPTADWVWRQLIEATAWGHRPRFLVRDRDRAYGGGFIASARAIGIESVLTPVRAPKANAIAERLVGTLRRECTNHVIPLNERHLRRVLLEYVDYYNATRPHRTLELETPEAARTVQRHGRVVAHPVLGGLHHRYDRDAA